MLQRWLILFLVGIRPIAEKCTYCTVFILLFFFCNEDLCEPAPLKNWLTDKPVCMWEGVTRSNDKDEVRNRAGQLGRNAKWQPR